MEQQGGSPAAAVADGGLWFDRFEVREELGSGGFGTVFRALDHVTRQEVALKVLHRVGQPATDRFKKEFRGVVEVEHPNLVRLGELFERKGVWAFTMELVPGEEFSTWVRGATGFREDRLRAGLLQLASALAALHAAGLVHRDVKPANVRVTPEGRVVLLDFSLVTHLGPSLQTTAQHAVGTLAYMAPEQVDNKPTMAAVDLYALGVLLYEALTGRLPFSGDMLQLLLAKYGQSPLPPRALCADVPADLEAICLELLSSAPEQRPTAAALVARLGGAAEHSRLGSSAPPKEFFVGRASELGQLAQHFADAQRDGPLLVLIEGEGGIGKTALIRHFVATVRSGPVSAHALRGRCHPFEHVTYQAFDDIIDQLVRLLRARSEHAAALPESSRMLVQLFPALSKVSELAERAGTFRAPRSELFDAFRELLAFLARESALLVTIDDLQWSDSESVTLLKNLLDVGGLQRVLFLASMRPLETQERPALEPLSTHPRTRRIPLPTLKTEDARDLARHLLAHQASATRIDQLLADARGHPLFLVELAREERAPAPASEGGAVVKLEAVIRRRVQQLPASARRVLELLCVAAAPVPHSVISEALEMPIATIYRAVATLRSERLARSLQTGEVVVYHDRSREAVVSALAPEVCARAHATLAEAWLRAERTVPSRVASHFLAAGDDVRAAPWLERAASEALATAGFESAADLLKLRLSLAGVPLEGESRSRVQLALADALAGAGRCAESAHVLLDALERADPDQRRELLLRAAQQLLQAGEVEAGLRAARSAVEEVGLVWSRGALPSLARLGLSRASLRWKASAEPAVNPAIPPAAARQLDTLSRLLHPLFWADLLRCAEMVARYARLAFRHGSPPHMARALGMQSVMATLSRPAQPRLDLNDRAARWATLDGTSEVLAYQEFTRGGCLVVASRLDEAVAHFERAETLYRTQCPGQVWMQVNARTLLLACLFMTGKHRLFALRAGDWLRDASTRGDAFARAQLITIGCAGFRHLIADDPEQVLAEVEEVVGPWRVNSFGLHHLGELDATHHALQYADPRRAHAWWRRERSKHRLLYGRLKGYVPDLLDSFRAEALLGAALRSGRSDLARQAGRLSEALMGATTPRARARGLLIRAQLLANAGERRAARGIAQLAHETFHGECFGVAAEILAAALTSQSERRACEERVLAWFAQEGWREPERALSWMLPIYPLLRKRIARA